MSNPLLELSKHRTKAKPKSRAAEKSRENVPGSTPIEDLALGSIQGGADLFEDFQRMRIARTSHNGPKEDEELSYTRKQMGYKDYALPKGWKKRNMKDYRPGPVKIYTKAEIKEYEDGISV